MQLKEPFEHKTFDGRDVTTVVTFENSRFITLENSKLKEVKCVKVLSGLFPITELVRQDKVGNDCNDQGFSTQIKYNFYVL